MKWKKDNKIPNTKSKLSDSVIAKIKGKKSGMDEYDTDSDNLDTSNYEDDEEEEEDDDDDVETGQNAYNSGYNKMNMNVKNKTLMI